MHRCSENVLKEGDTTEAVDRESIANLSSTKKQWETIFTSNVSPTGGNTETSGGKKKAQPKWEVRLPYKEKHPAPSPGSQALSPGDSTSDASPTSTMSSSGLVPLLALKLNFMSAGVKFGCGSQHIETNYRELSLYT